MHADIQGTRQLQGKNRRWHKYLIFNRVYRLAGHADPISQRGLGQATVGAKLFQGVIKLAQTPPLRFRTENDSKNAAAVKVPMAENATG